MQREELGRETERYFFHSGARGQCLTCGEDKCKIWGGGGVRCTIYVLISQQYRLKGNGDGGGSSLAYEGPPSRIISMARLHSVELESNSNEANIRGGRRTVHVVYKYLPRGLL